MKMKYPKYNYQNDIWSKINKLIFTSKNKINQKKDQQKQQQKQQQQQNYNNNDNNNKSISSIKDEIEDNNSFDEYCNNNCKINNNNGYNYNSFNNNSDIDESTCCQDISNNSLENYYYGLSQSLPQSQPSILHHHHQQPPQQLSCSQSIDITRESPNSQQYLKSSTNYLENKVENWFKEPEDWEINLKILYQLKWRKQMTPCFKRYKSKYREKVTNDHFKF